VVDRISTLHSLQALRGGALALLAVVLVATAPVTGQQGATNGEWRFFSGDSGATRYSPLDQITRDNVKNLKIAWTWKSDNFGSPPEIRNQATPIMVNGVLYFPAGSRRAIVAMDAGTGETLWTWRIDEGLRWEKAPRRNSGRGVAYWTDGRGDDRIFTVTPGFQLVALNAKTGQQVQGFGQKGSVDLFKELDIAFDPTGTIGNSSPPVVCRDVVIVGPAQAEMSRPKSKTMTKADIMGFDVRTGKKLWTFHSIPRPGEFGADTWLNQSNEYTGNAGAWTTFTADNELGYVYLPVESATGDYYGGHRPGSNLFTSTLVALDASTGKRIWYYQLIHHDIWDYDIVSSPVLLDVKIEGKQVKLVIQATKQAFLYVFDRVTGKPIWPIEEKPVPQNAAPGEWTSPTQPFPARPPAFDRQGITTDDLIDWTPELRQKAIEALKPYRIGPLYQPGSLAQAPDGTKGTLVLPGNLGGSNWESTAADPETGHYYVSSITRPTRFALVKPTPAESDMNLIGLALNPPQPDVEGLPYLKPPYGRITAYDMNTGDIVWQKANGETPPAIKNHPMLKDLNIPKTGGNWRSSILVTKTMLLVGEGWGGPPMFRAMDKATGEILWETQIPAGSTSGLPMTYMHKGKQYIVVAAGGQTASVPAQLVAWALPGPAPTPASGVRGEK
jgi:quinoprotein glucose dehydrogenase